MSAVFNVSKAIIDTPQPAPSDNPWLYFDTSLPYAIGQTFTVIDAGAIPGTPVTYENHDELTRTPHVWIVRGGKNTSPQTHTAGRTGIFHDKWSKSEGARLKSLKFDWNQPDQRHEFVLTRYLLISVGQIKGLSRRVGISSIWAKAKYSQLMRSVKKNFYHR